MRWLKHVLKGGDPKTGSGHAGKIGSISFEGHLKSTAWGTCWIDCWTIIILRCPRSPSLITVWWQNPKTRHPSYSTSYAREVGRIFLVVCLARQLTTLWSEIFIRGENASNLKLVNRLRSESSLVMARTLTLDTQGYIFVFFSHSPQSLQSENKENHHSYLHRSKNIYKRKSILAFSQICG